MESDDVRKHEPISKLNSNQFSLRKLMIACFGSSLLMSFSVLFLYPINSNPELREDPGLRAFFVGFGLFVSGVLGAGVTAVSYISILFISPESDSKNRKLRKSAEWFLVFLGIMFVPMLFILITSFIFQR